VLLATRKRKLQKLSYLEGKISCGFVGSAEGVSHWKVDFPLGYHLLVYCTRIILENLPRELEFPLLVGSVRLSSYLSRAGLGEKLFPMSSPLNLNGEILDVLASLSIILVFAVVLRCGFRWRAHHYLAIRT